MLKPKKGFVQLQLDIERLIPLQWGGIMKAMDNYALHYHLEQNIPDVNGSYFISNIDNQIHNINDRLHNIIEHDGWTEISIIDSDGCEIENCCLHKTLKELFIAIS